MTALAALLVTAALSFFASPSAPPCIDNLVTGESGARASAPAPVVEPARGSSGWRVTIRGKGYRPGTRLIIAAVYGDHGCVIQGVGDEYLASVVADGRGAYSVTVRWPTTFDPVLGRNKGEPAVLPGGRYYVFALPCAARAACSFTTGTQPGGPFMLRDARASPGGWIALSVVVACAAIGGVMLIKRSR